MNLNTSLEQSSIVKNGLRIYLQNKQMRTFLKWGIINIAVLMIVLFDLSSKCPYALSKWFYIEYVAAALLGLSTLYYFSKYFYLWITFEPINGTIEQKHLLHFDDGDTSFIVKSSEKPTKSSVTSTPLNTTQISWHSSFNDVNRTKNSPMWSYNRSANLQSPNNLNHSWNNQNFNTSVKSNASSNQSLNNSFNLSLKTYTKDEIITEERGLQKYLREIAKEETPGNFSYSDIHDNIDRSSMNTLWNYCNNAANLLKTSIYQLSPTTVSPNKQSSGKEFLIGKSIGPGCSDLEGVSDSQKTISSSKLTKYVTNLRIWVSATILQRLVREFDKIDQEFAARGFCDIKIGIVSLERLKKTAENQHMVAMHVPTLPMVIPFLEMSTNQEYLVQRIRELAKGSGINDYRWNGGYSYNSNWVDHVTTDSAIIFHLFCAYMDSQLMPLPQPGGRSFFNRYVVWGEKKPPKETIEEVRAKAKFAILCSNPVKPKFNFICDDKIHNCNHDRNNLFCVIIHFLIYVRERNSGLLDGVNLGRSGLNILGVIED